ncbi:MAG: hypothetical protein K8R53_05920 [Bacteroidales bacterium]|nr:hypothetical protein [Bacteroidales bacterium]
MKFPGKLTGIVELLAGLTVLVLTLYFHSNTFPKNELEQMPNEWFFKQRAYPFGEIPQEEYIAAANQAIKMKSEHQMRDDSSLWVFAGPLNIGGRLTDVEMIPTNFQTIYAGTASGGIFKSDNSGLSWNAIFDNTLSLSIGDIALAPSNQDIIYVGTGEANAGGGSLAYDGVGIYKSINAGTSWQYLGLPESRNVGRIVVHPLDPDIVYVAAMGSLFADNQERGVYRTANGGQSWEQILFVSDSTGAIDICINPEHPDTLYAAMWERIRRPYRRSYGGPTCGIYRTYDGGSTWTELTNGIPSPSNNIGRIGIDICDSDPSVLYTIYADKTGYFEGVYKTTDHGDTWIQTNDGSLGNSYASYGWWLGRIEVDPVDSDKAFVLGFDLYRTANGGNSWSNVSSVTVHVDQHGVYIHPLNNDLVVLGNDGGLYISQNGGNSWNWINNIPITQFYTCEVDEQFPERLYGGTQDNGTNRTMTGNLDDWESIYWGDGFCVLVDPVDNNFVYAEYQYGNFARSTNGGNSFSPAMNGISSSDRKNWNTPVIFDPQNPENLYYGSNKLYKSTNRAASWSVISPDLSNGPGPGNLTYGTITTIAVSPANSDIVYAGTDDGNVWVSMDDGGTWSHISVELPERWVTRVAADPVEENTVYVTFSGYRYDEFLPHVFRSEDSGQTWEDVSGDLPEAPINDIIIDPDTNTTLYVANDFGVFSSTDLGQSWDILGENLPLIPVCDIDLHQPTRKLIAATYGRSMFTYDLNQDTIVTSTYTNQQFPLDFSASVNPNPIAESGVVEINCDEETAGKLQLF